MHDYRIENTSIGNFYFSCLCCRASVDTFSRIPLFHHFYPKIVANAHFDPLFSRILGGLTEKRKTLWDFPL